MEYTIDMCSLYKKVKIGNIPVIVFEEHNMALPVWGIYAHNLKQPLALISLDTHADTHDPFARKVGVHEYQYEKFKQEILSKLHYNISNFCFEDVYKLACVYLANDEHILAACLFGYISEYSIFCKLSDDELRDYEKCDSLRGLNASYYSKYSILSMSEEEIKQLCKTPYILDFDIDYFSSSKIFEDKRISKLSRTISRFRKMPGSHTGRS